MKWMLIAAGLLAAVSALALMAAWGRWFGKKNRSEVSLAATVKRVTLSGETGSMASFVYQGGVMNFSIPREIARQLNPGDRGVLTYQGSDFVYFVSKERLMERTGEPALAKVS